MPNCVYRLSLFSLLVLFASSLFAQRQYGGVATYIEKEIIRSEVDQIQSKNLTKATKQSFDKAKGMPSNITALPILKSTTLKSTESLNDFTQLSNHTTWIQRIELPSETESFLRLSDFDVPAGGRLYVIGDNGAQVLGAYTSSNRTDKGNFMCGPITGSYIIEYNSPEFIDAVPFHVEEIYVGTTDYGTMTTGFGTAYDCMINVNCDEGRKYDDEKKGVVRIRMVGDEGVALCTGTLLNNTSLDRTPYVLTAYHCERPAGLDFTPQYDLWYFDFNFEANSCAVPSEEPTFVAVQGAEKVSELEDTDMMLVKITSPIPVEANAYYNGWDIREEYLPIKTALIHHPNGDIKKISQDVDTSRFDETERAWDNGTVSSAGSHIRSEFDDATFQPGSSGAPLFDDRGRVVGQLHGGPRSDEFCTIAISYCGRTARSWEGGGEPISQLKVWLDPEGTGAQLLDGLEAESQSQIVKFNGRVVTADGIAISNVQVSLGGDVKESFFTGDDGRFVFDNLSSKGSFTFELEKNTDAANGLSSLDLILVTNHILGRAELPNVFQRFAADVNGDGRVSSIDLIQMTNVILAKTDQFPDQNSWGFEPELLQMSGGDLSGGTAEFTIIGFKRGDVNFSANPRK